MVLDVATCWVLALCVVSLAAVSTLFRGRWCPLGCLSRQPKAYGDHSTTREYDPLLPQLSPIVYCYSGASPDFHATLHAISHARTSVEVNDALPGPALEWMFTTAAEALAFVTLCHGHVDFSAIMVSNLASLVVGLQPFAVANEPIAQFITDCFRAKVAGDLLRLKHEIEKRVPVYDVVFRRIPSRVLQECILTHMELQARVLRGTQGFEPPIKLLSEIDDAVFVARDDPQYPTLTVFPGVQQFVHEVLDDNTYRRHEGRPSLDHRDQRPVFLTKRTEMWRRLADDELTASGFDHYTLLVGTIHEMLGGDDAAVQHKLQSIHQYKCIFGECDFVFVGHNKSSSDVALGDELLRYPERYGVSAALVHDVRREQPSTSNGSAVRFFRTYVGAAFQLCQLDVIGLDAAARVARAVATAFPAIPFERTEQQDAAAFDIAAELIDVLDVLPPREAYALLDMMPRAVLRFLSNRLPVDDGSNTGEHLIL